MCVSVRKLQATHGTTFRNARQRDSAAPHFRWQLTFAPTHSLAHSSGRPASGKLTCDGAHTNGRSLCAEAPVHLAAGLCLVGRNLGGGRKAGAAFGGIESALVGRQT